MSSTKPNICWTSSRRGSRLEHVKLGFKWKNIAFAKTRYKQGDELVLLENRGTTFSIGAEYIY